jgi:16S rRNA (guanine1516-N2)-methyltransferase
VLKWPLRAAAPPAPRKPSHQIAGKTVRYDVYVRPRVGAGLQARGA